MTTGVMHEHNMHKKIEKQMGCMSGFLHIFGRHQLFSANKRLPAPKGDDVSLETEKLNKSPADKLNKSAQVTRSMTFPIAELTSMVESPLTALPMALFDVNEVGIKSCPRLSLDSRATLDAAKGSLYRKQMQIKADCGMENGSTSVIAKLMGIEPLSNLTSSASESNGNDNLNVKQITSNVIRENESRRGGSIFERRLKMRRIDKPSRDLETLKQILEAMQLKGLVHSNRIPHIINKNVVLMKPLNPRVSDESNSGNIVSSVSPRRQRQSIHLNVHSPVRATNSRTSNSTVKTKQLTIQTQRGGTQSVDSRRVSPTRNLADQAVTNRSSMNRKPIEDEFSSSISDCRVSTPSQTHNQRFKASEYKQGSRLLNRCDKLLNSIAEMNATESQPSPVSVLDSSLSPSPVIKRNISFPVELEELGSPALLDCENEINDSDFIYISKVIKAWNFAPEEAKDYIFLELEKQHYTNNKDTSKVSKLQRRLIFDTITEIMERNRSLPPWKALAFKNWNTSRSLVQQIWSEFQRIRVQQSSDDLFEVICGILKKDLVGDAINGWGDCPLEMSEAVLDIERLIFKDLVEESIRDLAESAAKSTYLARRRKLVF